MGKTIWWRYGTGSASAFTGLTPTLTIFATRGGSLLAAPGITESPAGTGLYSFQYATGITQSIVYEVDGGSNLSATDRYRYGALDPQLAVDEKLGHTSDSFGSTSADPSTVIGYLKRAQEWLEGNATYVKSTGKWQVSSRGSSTLLQEKSLANNTTQATKT